MGHINNKTNYINPQKIDSIIMINEITYLNANREYVANLLEHI